MADPQRRSNLQKKSFGATKKFYKIYVLIDKIKICKQVFSKFIIITLKKTIDFNEFENIMEQNKRT